MTAPVDWRTALRELDVGEHAGAALFPLGPDDALDTRWHSGTLAPVGPSAIDLLPAPRDR